MTRFQKLRTTKDGHRRKSMNDGRAWTAKLLEELHKGKDEETQEQTTKKRKGKKADTAKRLNSDFS